MSKYIKQYPWIRMLNLYTGKLYANHDAMDEFPEGWKAAFGDMMLEELDEAIKREPGFMDEFYVVQVKEKYGSLRFYVSCSNNEINDIISKYECLSTNICVNCGKPDVPMLNLSWISPYCRECAARLGINDEQYDELAEDDGVMNSIYKYIKFTKDGKQEIQHDYSDTIKKIRSRYTEFKNNVMI